MIWRTNFGLEIDFNEQAIEPEHIDKIGEWPFVLVYEKGSVILNEDQIYYLIDSIELTFAYQKEDDINGRHKVLCRDSVGDMLFLEQVSSWHDGPRHAFWAHLGRSVSEAYLGIAQIDGTAVYLGDWETALVTASLLRQALTAYHYAIASA